MPILRQKNTQKSPRVNLVSKNGVPYTISMNLLMTITLACVLTASPEDGPPPPNRPVYEIRIDGEEEPLYGFVDENDWTSKSVVKIELDAPWSAEPCYSKAFNPQKATRLEEWSGGRNDRLARQARKLGLRWVKGKYRPQEEVDWARKAEEMAAPLIAAELLKPTAVPVATPSGNAQPVAKDNPATPGLLKRWGGQGAILVVALALLGFVAKTMILAKQ